MSTGIVNYYQRFTALFSDIPHSLTKQRPQDFTRSRLLPLHRLIPFVLSLVASGKDKGVDTKIGDLFTHARRSGLWPEAESVHRSAVSKARAKLDWQAFQSLFGDAVKLAYECFPPREEYLWNGYSVWAIDGSKYALPATTALRTEFDPSSGLDQPGKGHYPQCLVSTLYDVFRRIPVARTVVPLAEADEREQALQLLAAAPNIPNTISLFDQGYPSFRLVHALSAQNRLFIMRCPAAGSFSAVASFIASGEPEALIWVTPSGEFKRSLPKQERSALSPIRLRVVRLEHPDGKVSALLSNLFDKMRFPRSDLIGLYSRRWAIENHYRDEKSLLHIEQFHSKSSNGIRQELFAVLTAMVISRTLSALSVDSESFESPKCHIQPQLKNAVMALAREAALLTPSNPDTAMAIFRELIDEIRRVKHYRSKFPREPQPRVNKSPVNKWQQNRAKQVMPA